VTNQPDIRLQVSRAYAEAVSRPASNGGCCSGPSPKGVAARAAGYGQEDLAGLPEDAVANAFGCGNPVAFSEVGEGEVVLDLGSGAGLDLLLAARKVGPTGRVIGVDMTPEMLERARRNVADQANIEVRQGFIEELPVEDCSVDWVISNCVINLSPDKPRVFREIARVLKPGGRMRVSDIVVQDLPEEVRRDPALYCSCISGAISEEEYLQGLRAAGLQDVEVLERAVYSGTTLEDLVKSELPVNQRSCCGPAAGMARSLEGRVWSARFAARKAPNAG
jgi:SAM-dependent methyltransferase